MGFGRWVSPGANVVCVSVASKSPTGAIKGRCGACPLEWGSENSFVGGWLRSRERLFPCSPYRTKGILYLGMRCKQDCPNKLRNCSLESAEQRIGEIFAKLSLTDAELSELPPLDEIKESIVALEKLLKKL